MKGSEDLDGKTSKKEKGKESSSSSSSSEVIDEEAAMRRNTVKCVLGTLCVMVIVAGVFVID